MSDLQLGLIILGAIIIGGVLAYNWLQEKKLRKEVSSDFIVPQKDVLADDFHINTDAYVIDKELAEVKEKSKQFMQHTIPGEMKIADGELESAELESAVYGQAQADNYVEAQILASASENMKEDLITDGQVAEATINESISTTPIIKLIKATKLIKINKKLLQLPQMQIFIHKTTNRQMIFSDPNLKLPSNLKSIIINKTNNNRKIA